MFTELLLFFIIFSKNTSYTRPNMFLFFGSPFGLGISIVISLVGTLILLAIMSLFSH